MQAKSTFKNFTDNNENTMNAYTASTALRAYQTLHNQYSGHMPATKAFNASLEKIITTIFNSFTEHELLSEDSPLTAKKMHERAFKNIHEDALAKQMPLPKVMFLILTAIMDESVKWTDGSTHEDRLKKLATAFEEVLTEGNCDTGVRNKLFGVLHASYPDIFIIGEIGSELTAYAIDYYRKLLADMPDKEALSLTIALIRHETGTCNSEQSKENIKQHIGLFYNKEALEKHLRETMLKLLGKERYEGLQKGDEGLDAMIADRVANIMELPLPIPKGKEPAFLGLKTLIQAEKEWPLAVRQSFPLCDSIEALAESLPCRIFLSCKQLTKDIAKYVHKEYLAIGETEQLIVNCAEKIREKISVLESMLSAESADTNALKQGQTALDELEKALADAIDTRAKEKDIFMENSLGSFFSIENEAQKVSYFQKIIAHVSEKKLVVTDSILEQWEKQIDKENDIPVARYLTLEQMNRLFLTAIMTMPSIDWSRSFAAHLQEAVTFIKNLSEKDNLAYHVKKSSYPKALLDELEWLIAVKNAGISNPLPELAFKLPLPCNIGLPAEKQQEAFENFYPIYPIVLLAEPMWLNKQDIPAL